MNRRTFLVALAGTPALAALIAACGDSAKTGSKYSFPQVKDEVVLRIASEGGFVAPGTNFVALPTLLISGDGKAFTPGIMTEQYPGPLMSPLFVQSISKLGIEKVLKLADDAGLLGPAPDYTMPPDFAIADVPDTVVTITVNGKTYEHRANALGFELSDGHKSTPARENLNTFVNLLVSDLKKVGGADNVGDATEWLADTYRLQATPVDPTQWTDPAPTITDWPATTGLQLADAAQCATIAQSKVGDLFTKATQLTFFKEGDVVYQLAVVGALPGDALCA